MKRIEYEKNIAWKEYFPKSKKTHLAVFKPCPSCGIHYTPQPRSERISQMYLYMKHVVFGFMLHKTLWICLSLTHLSKQR